MKINWKKTVKDEVIMGRLKLASLFVLGFLIGMMLKSQASRTIVSGYDDSQALNSDEIKLSQEVLDIN